MIRMKWIEARDGDSYNKYLYDDIGEEIDLRGSSEYFSKSSEFQRSQLYTSIDGTLAHTLSINGPADRRKLNIIDGLIDSRPGKVSNGKQSKRSSVEVISSLDKTFSYAYQILETQEQKDMFIECLKRVNSSVFDNMFDEQIKDLNGNSGQFIRSTMIHIENRDEVPHIHFHTNYYNYILGADGKVRSIELPAIRDTSLKEAIDFVFKTEAIRELQRFFPELHFEAYNKDGNKLQDQHDKVKDFRVAFDSQSLDKIKAQSNLSERIDKEVKRRIAALDKSNSKYAQELKYLNSKKHREEVHKQIKPQKQSKSQATQNETLETHTASLSLKYKSAHDVGVLSNNTSTGIVDKIKLLNGITETNDSFTKNDLIAHIAKSKCSGLESIQLAQQLIEDKQRVLYDDKTKRYVPMDLLKQEVENVERSNRLVNKEVSSIPFKEKLLEGANEQQAQLVREALGEHQFHIGVGLPGTGKSFTAAKVVEAAKASNYTTIGVAPTGKVASALKVDTGCDKAYTLDKLLLDIQQEKLTLTPESYLVLDEAGMVGCRNWNKLLTAVEKSGARLLAIGDPDQLESVSAGDTLRQLLKGDAGTHATTLNQIVRQKDETALEQANLVSMSNVASADKALVKESGKTVDELFNSLTQTQLSRFTNEEEKLSHIAKRYILSNEAEKDKIILCSTNSSVDELNRQIVKHKLDNGLLLGDATAGFYINDRVMIRKNSKELKNGDMGTIQAIDKKGVATIKLDNNQFKEINLIEDSNISHAYAITIHKSQGITVNKPFFNLELSQVNSQNLLNVAMTRGRQLTDIFVVDSQLEAVKQSYKQQSKKVDLIALHKQVNAQKPEQAAPAPKIEQVKATSKPTPSFNQTVELARFSKKEKERMAQEAEQRKKEEQRRAQHIDAFKRSFSFIRNEFVDTLSKHYDKNSVIEAFDMYEQNAFIGNDEYSNKSLNSLKTTCQTRLAQERREIEKQQKEQSLTAKAQDALKQTMKQSRGPKMTMY